MLLTEEEKSKPEVTKELNRLCNERFKCDYTDKNTPKLEKIICEHMYTEAQKLDDLSIKMFGLKFEDPKMTRMNQTTVRREFYTDLD